MFFICRLIVNVSYYYFYFLILSQCLRAYLARLEPRCGCVIFRIWLRDGLSWLHVEESWPPHPRALAVYHHGRHGCHQPARTVERESLLLLYSFRYQGAGIIVPLLAHEAAIRSSHEHEGKSVWDDDQGRLQLASRRNAHCAAATAHGDGPGDPTVNKIHRVNCNF